MIDSIWLEGSRLPDIMLSAKTSIDDRIRGLQAGGIIATLIVIPSVMALPDQD